MVATWQKIEAALEASGQKRAVLGMLDWRELGGNGAHSIEREIALRSPETGDFQPNDAALPQALPLSTVVPPGEWTPWTPSEVHTVGPFALDLHQTAVSTMWTRWNTQP